MKRQFVRDLEEGDVVNDYFVAVRKDLRDTQSGGKFLGMAFKDKTGQIGGVMWNNAASVASVFELGDVVNVRGTVNTHQEKLQVRVDQVLPLKDGEYDANDLVATAVNLEAAEAALIETLHTIGNEWLSRLVRSFLEDEAFMAEYRRAAAGKKWHHAYRGGLMQHCHEMLRIATLMCELFPNLDRDLLLAGIFLHDIGKLREMTHDLNVDYTTPGKLVGHVQIGCEMAGRRMDTIEGFPETLRHELYHLILSHHGELQFGSPVVPKTVEAIVLYHIDNLDAQADAYSRIVEETKARNQTWSEYMQLIDRQIWTREW